MEVSLQNSRIDSLKKPYQPFEIEVDVLRLDLIHPVISGNKWFKLQGHLNEAKEQTKKTIITFGGAYSNHLVATAAACQSAGLQSVGIVRGEMPQSLSHTLQDTAKFDMDLYFISRQDYTLKKIPDAVTQKYPADIYVVAEGGFGEKGSEGIADLLKESLANYTHILASVGTGTTLAGLISAASAEQKIIGISALKGAFELADRINTLLPYHLQNNFTLLHDFHFGGYAKHTPQLLRFMNDWFTQTGIPSDFVYTAKMFFAADHLIRNQTFEHSSRLLLIHSGGLQGNRSLPEGTLIF
ncbi:MAG: hypothetical protein JWP88_159 [Flaviaesturariibacter sp.]|nr:hypothetical protein [Flaviaesturariibacter sp.]